MSLLDRKNAFDPNKEYYFVDYHDINECRWIRSPYNTIEEVTEILSRLPYVFDKDAHEVLPMFRGLRVTPHVHLAKLYRIWNDEEKKWENDVITNGCALFGSLYDHDEMFGMPPSLTKKEDESLEEWEARVAARDEETKQSLKKEFAEDCRRKQIWCSYETPEVAFLLGQSMKKKFAKKILDRVVKNDESDEE